MISIVIPVHNEEGNIEPLHREVKAVMDGLGTEYEILYVNDGSTDKSGEVLSQLKAQDPKVRVIEMDRNRGEAAALTAGFHSARGDIILSMDGDGQNDPAYIPELLEKLKEGYKAASGWREKRKEPFLSRVLPSKVANWVIGMVTRVRIHDNGCSLKAYRAGVVKGIQIPHGFHRFMPAIFGVKGGEVAEVRIKDRPRLSGTSHYGLSRTFEVLRELITIPFVIDNPERWAPRLRFLFRFSLVFLFLYLLFCIWMPSGLYFTLVFALVIAFFGTASQNLSRFLRAQEEGVFKAIELEG